MFDARTKEFGDVWYSEDDAVEVEYHATEYNTHVPYGDTYKSLYETKIEIMGVLVCDTPIPNEVLMSKAMGRFVASLENKIRESLS